MTKVVGTTRRLDERRRLPRVAAPKPMPTSLDEIDARIVEVFRADGRLSNAEAARALGVSEGTVRRRVDRLVERRVLKFAALTDPRALGLHVEALIGLNVEAGSLDRVGRELAKMREIRFLGITMGALDVLVVARFPSLDAWLTFRSQHLARITGIQRTETFQIIRVLKRTYDWIFETPEGVDETAADATATRRAATRRERPAAAARRRRAIRHATVAKAGDVVLSRPNS